MQTPPSTYIGDGITQRLIKKRALASQQTKDIEPTDEDGKDPTDDVKRKYYPSS